MNQDLDIALLRTFVAIVDTGGLTSAGRKVGRTQPAITHQISRLEDLTGRTLFEDNRRKLSLTHDGEVLLEFARAMLRINDEARGRFSTPDIAGHVTLGTPDLYAPYILAGSARKLLALPPERGNPVALHPQHPSARGAGTQ